MTVQPNQGHMLKAIAWDALYIAFDIQSKTAKRKIDRDRAAKWRGIMDANLDAVTKQLADPDFWKKQERR